jgi:hypothetical protein
VDYRSHPRQPHLFLLQHRLFPSPPVSPLFPSPYSLTYTTAILQLLCHQFLTHSFRHDGGCTPSPILGLTSPLSTKKIAPSFSCTSTDPFCNPFVFKFIQGWAGVCTLSHLLPSKSALDVPAFGRADVQMRCMYLGRLCGTIRPLCPIAQTTTPLRMYTSPMLCSLPPRRLS